MMNNILPGLAYSSMMYGLPFTSNMFTRISNSGTRKPRGWSEPRYTPKPSLNSYVSQPNSTSKSYDRDTNQSGSYVSALSPTAGDVSSAYNNAWGADALKTAGLGALKSGALTAGAAALAGATISTIAKYGLMGMANPASMTSALGNAAAAGAGVDVSGGAQKLGSILGTLAGSLLGPAGAIIGGVVAPFAADAVLDVVNARSLESVRDIAEDLGGTYVGGRTLGTGMVQELANMHKDLGYGQQALTAANLAAARSNVRNRPGNTFDPVNGPQAMARAALEETGMQGWEVQARIKEAMKVPSLGLTRKTYSPHSIEAQASVVQGPAGQSISKALNSLAMSQTALTNPSFNAALTTTRQAVDAMGFNPQSFSQPEMTDTTTSVSAPSTDSFGQGSHDSAIGSVGFDTTGHITSGWGGSDGRGNSGSWGGHDSAIDSVGFDSSGHMTGGWSGGDLGLGSSLGGIGSSLGSDAIGGRGWSGVGGRGGDADSMNGPW